MIRLILLFVLVVGSVSAHGSIVYGQGNLSCEDWTMRQDVVRQQDLAWVLGYVSASALHIELGEVRASLFQTNAPAIASSIDKHCAEFPLDTVEHAAQELVLILMKKAKI